VLLNIAADGVAFLKRVRMPKRTLSGVLMLLIALCSQSLAQQPPSPPAAAPPSDARIAPHKWDVDRVRCSDLLGAEDDDRAAAVMFYFGYLAAKAGIHVVDVSRITDNTAKVMQLCKAKPEMTVPQAFRQALRPQR
jgi:HdeA/HdeB family